MFKVGDRVRRVAGNLHCNMNIGDIGTVKETFTYPGYENVILLKEFYEPTSAFDASNFELVPEQMEIEFLDRFQKNFKDGG